MRAGDRRSTRSFAWNSTPAAATPPPRAGFAAPHTVGTPPGGGHAPVGWPHGTVAPAGVSGMEAMAALRAIARGPDNRGMGIFLGSGARGWAWSGCERSTLVLGPSRSGKTSSLIVPNVLVAPGPVLTTSTKADVLRQTASARSEQGWCFLFDPSGTVDAPSGVHRVGWSPVTAATAWDGALRTADAMVRTARGQAAGAGAGPESH